MHQERWWFLNGYLELLRIDLMRISENIISIYIYMYIYISIYLYIYIYIYVERERESDIVGLFLGDGILDGEKLFLGAER